MENEINLKPTDKKLLSHLYYNSRENSSKIARQIYASREQIAYRTKKFEEQKIIKGYIPLVNYSKLGYKLISLILFKFNKQNQIKEFKNKIKESKNRIITIEILAKYDLGILFVFKNEKERNEYISELLNQSSSEISGYLIIEPYFSEYYPLKFLGDTKSQPKVFHEYNQKEYTLDDKEKKILSILNQNANSRIIDIAKKTNFSAELIVYKIEKLKKENILLNTRAYFDMKKIGYFYSIILINLHNFSKSNQEKLRNFSRNSKHTDSLMIMTGKPNCYIQIFHKNIKELYETIEELKKTFSEESIITEILPLKNEGEDINTIPFL